MPTYTTSTSKPLSTSPRGFALVITLSLMSFVLLLVLSLLTLLQVENSTATTSAAQLEARMNAQLGAMIALGDLQRYTGPDQRVTAKADLAANTDISKQNYTAAWSAVPANQDEAPLQWLTSAPKRIDGGETVQDFDPAEPTQVAWPILVAERSDSSGVKLAEAVRAQPLPIEGQNNTNTGEYAWWIGDEGVKAKLTLTEDEALIGSTAEVDKKQRLRSTARSGIELIGEFGNEKYPYEAEGFRKNLSKLINFEQAEAFKMSDAASKHFHDVTVHSKMLLTDVENGGLKDDLTYLLSKGTLEGSIFEDLKEDADLKELEIPDAYKRVTWEQLKSFSELGAELAALGENDALEARAQTETLHGVAPILAMLHLNFGITFSSNYDATEATNEPAERQYGLRHHIRPWFVLANPYNTALKITNYRIRFQATWSKAQVFIEYGGTRSKLIPEFLPRDLYPQMVFTVPAVELGPGEAKIFTLSYKNWGDYDYTFSTSDFTTNFNCDLKNASILGFSSPPDPAKAQQFVFEESYDGGLASIRLVPGTPAATISGAELEFDSSGTRRIKPLGWHYCNWNGTNTNYSGTTWIRTYLGSEADDLDADRLVQNIGPVLGDPNSLSEQLLGFWEFDKIPSDFTNKEQYVVHPSGSRFSESNMPPSWKINKTINAASSLGIYLAGATNEAAANESFTTNAGWLSDFNLRSPRVVRQTSQQKNALGHYLGRYHRNGAQGYYNFTDKNIVANSASFPWGVGYKTVWNTSPDGDPFPRRAILFDLPRGPVEGDLNSIAQLQHFNAGGYLESAAFYALSEDFIKTDISGGELTYGPAYAIGNSYASPFIKRDEASAKGAVLDVLDNSYLLNDIFFDHYIFSTLSGSGQATALRNPRLKMWSSGSEESFESTRSSSVSESFFIDGGFNVNSTSVDAWEAFLGSFKGLEYGDKSDGFGVFPRSLEQIDGSVDSTWDAQENREFIWAGWRHIEEGDLRDLAVAIVEQVKLRGPFRSFADFVNRQLTTDVKGLSGALQAALDKTQNFEYYAIDPTYAVDTVEAGKSYEYADGGSAHVGSGIIANSATESTPAAAIAGIPGWVLQGDLLQSLGPAMSVRSDTFTIRSYGNSTEAINNRKTSESYYELVVQRMPEYVDGTSNTPEVVGSSLSLTNQAFGRRYIIVSQRHLATNQL